MECLTLGSLPNGKRSTHLDKAIGVREPPELA